MADVIICRTAAYAKYDVREHVPAKILAMGPALQPTEAVEGGPIVSEYFTALADPGYWSDVDRLALGKSMHSWLPATMLRALLRASEIAAGRPLLVSAEDGAQPAAVPAIERALAAWLVATVGRVGVAAEALDLQEFTYFVVSGAHRAGALRKVLHARAPEKRFANIADVGAGIGMIPLLLAADPAMAIRSVCLVEPSGKFVQPGETLWTLAAGPDLAFEFQQSSAEAAVLPGGRDLIFFGQCFYLIEESRRSEVVAQVSRALADGGQLIVNEAVRSDPATADPEWDKRYPNCLRLPQLIEELSTIGEVSVLRRGSDWQRPEDPRSLSAAEIGFDSFFAVSRS